MPVFGRRAPTPEQLGRYVPAASQLRVLRADGQRIDLTSRDTGTYLAATRQGWQSTAWQYRDMIGELRQAYRLLARAVARVRFYPAVTQSYPGDPIELDGGDHGLPAQLVADAMHNFALIPFDTNPDGYTARAAENLGVVGEGYVHIDADEQWHIRSTSEVNSSSDGRVMIAGLPGGSAVGQRLIDAESEELLRMWVPHPEWGQLADSAMRTLLDVAEDVILAGREQRAAARSRVAANGLLLMPSSLSLVQTRETDDEEYDDSVDSDTFMADFTAAMLAPIRDDGDAQAVVPVVLRGDIEDLKEVRHVTLQRADSEQLIERQAAALLRLLHGIDVQREQVEGMGGLNHWSSWILGATAIKDQVLPMAETLAACHVQAFWRPAMEVLGHSPADINRLVIVADASGLAENPNRGQDARDAHSALVISDDALRTALGFDEDDKPTEQEYVRRLASSGRLPVADAAVVLGLAQRPGRETITVQGDTVTALPAAPERPAAAPGQVTPERPVPVQPSPETAPVVAAAAPLWEDDFRVDPDLSRRLADIDAALTERITVAADAALNRVMEKAGARLRSAAQKDKPLLASLTDVEVAQIPRTLGRDRAETFVPVQDLISDGYDRLRGQVTGWLAAAAVQTSDAVTALLHLDGPAADRVAATVRSRLDARTRQAWTVLAEALDDAAEDGMFELDDDQPGETTAGWIAPQDIAAALAVAGGDDLALTASGEFAKQQRRARKRRPMKRPRTAGAGFATGPVVTEIIAEHGGILLGHEWQYRPEMLRATFNPHKQLDGQRFTDWADPILDTSPATAWIGPSFHPNDHPGCRCTSSGIYAVPEDPHGIVAQRLREARGNPRNILYGQLAAEDTAAGRVGTSAQRTTELRDRITAAVEAMRADHIGSDRKRRR